MDETTLTHAHIVCQDDDTLSFSVPFNPTSVKIGRQLNWAEQSTQGQPYPLVQFSNGASDTFQASMLVDESESEDSVLPVVSRFYDLTRPIDAPEGGGPRPPCLVFSWEELSFQGVIKSLDVELLLFDRSGRPKRAMVNLSLVGKAFASAASAEDFFDQVYVAAAPRSA